PDRGTGQNREIYFPSANTLQVPKSIYRDSPPAFLKSYKQNLSVLEVRYLQIQNLDFFSENQNTHLQDLIHQRSSFYILLNKAPDKSQNVLI
ncbi:hypothetical protein CBP27_16535, partial [Fischerella thermalis WC542]